MNDYSRTVAADEIASADTTGMFLVVLVLLSAGIAIGMLWEVMFG